VWQLEDGALSVLATRVAAGRVFYYFGIRQTCLLCIFFCIFSLASLFGPNVLVISYFVFAASRYLKLARYLVVDFKLDILNALFIGSGSHKAILHFNCI
jgi:hypothetical protein